MFGTRAGGTRVCQYQGSRDHVLVVGESSSVRESGGRTVRAAYRAERSLGQLDLEQMDVEAELGGYPFLIVAVSYVHR